MVLWIINFKNYTSLNIIDCKILILFGNNKNRVIKRPPSFQYKKRGPPYGSSPCLEIFFEKVLYWFGNSKKNTVSEPV